MKIGAGKEEGRKRNIKVDETDEKEGPPTPNPNLFAFPSSHRYD